MLSSEKQNKQAGYSQSVTACPSLYLVFLPFSLTHAYLTSESLYLVQKDNNQFNSNTCGEIDFMTVSELHLPVFHRNLWSNECSQISPKK